MLPFAVMYAGIIHLFTYFGHVMCLVCMEGIREADSPLTIVLFTMG